MAPKKRKTPEAPETSAPVRVTRSVSRSPARVTRSGSAGSIGSAASAESGRKTKKPKRTGKGKQKKKKKKKQREETPSSSNPINTIVIEHSTQFDLFKTKAEEVKQGLEEKVAGITVIVNPKKPRKGCFQIRAEGGEKFISLMKLKRPYKRLKDLDTDKVISDIAYKINI